jgi:hypothetical protein
MLRFGFLSTTSEQQSLCTALRLKKQILVERCEERQMDMPGPMCRNLPDGISRLDVAAISVDKSLKEIVHDLLVAELTTAACPPLLRS